MSLPSRERGLKSHTLYSIESAIESLPSRERGLKYLLKYQNYSII